MAALISTNSSVTPSLFQVLRISTTDTAWAQEWGRMSIAQAEILKHLEIECLYIKSSAASESVYQVDEMEDIAEHECSNSSVYVSAGEFNEALGLRAGNGGIRADNFLHHLRGILDDDLCEDDHPAMDRYAYMVGQVGRHFDDMVLPAVKKQQLTGDAVLMPKRSVFLGNVDVVSLWFHVSVISLSQFKQVKTQQHLRWYQQRFEQCHAGYVQPTRPRINNTTNNSTSDDQMDIDTTVAADADESAQLQLPLTTFP